MLRQVVAQQLNQRMQVGHRAGVSARQVGHGSQAEDVQLSLESGGPSEHSLEGSKTCNFVESQQSLVRKQW